MVYLSLIFQITFCAVYSQSCSNTQSYCFSGLTLGHTWDQYSTQYIYEGDLNGCAYFKSNCDLYIYWNSDYNVWAITNNRFDGSALAACSETKLDNCINSKWHLSGSNGFDIDHNLKVEACDYDNIDCLATYNTDTPHCVANTDHRIANSDLSGKYLFEGCSMNKPHFTHTLSPGTQVTLTWNDILSAWFLKTVPDNAPYQTLGYCTEGELVDCTGKWEIYDTSAYILDPLVISGYCDNCIVDYDLCLDVFDAEYSEYGGRFSSDGCDSNGYPIFNQYENMDGDIDSLSKISFDAMNATFEITDINGDNLYAQCHSVSWKTCDGLWTPNASNLILSQCSTPIASLITTTAYTTINTDLYTTITESSTYQSNFVSPKTTQIYSLHQLKEENKVNIEAIIVIATIICCIVSIVFMAIFIELRRRNRNRNRKNTDSETELDSLEPGTYAHNTVIVDTDEETEEIHINEDIGMTPSNARMITTVLNAHELPVSLSEQAVIQEELSLSNNSMYNSPKVASIDARNYQQWNLQQLKVWLSSLENGRYQQYIPRLIDGFSNDDITAADLPDFPQGELVNFGVAVYKDRRGLMQQFERLRGCTIGEGVIYDEGCERETGDTKGNEIIIDSGSDGGWTADFI